MHPQLYHELPLVLRHAHQTCSSSVLNVADLEDPVWTMLVVHRSSVSVMERLATLQALVLLLSILLAAEEPALWKLAQSYMEVVTTLVIQLWLDAPRHLPSSMNPWKAWAVAESIRRTLLVANCIIDICHEMNYGGFKLTVFLASLPFDSSTLLWDAQSEKEWNSMMQGSQELISYSEFTIGWEEGRLAVQSPFESFLLAACKGTDYGELLDDAYAWLNV